jgi:hypothetical protein
MKSKYIFYLLFLVAIHLEVSRLIDSVHSSGGGADDSSYQDKGARFEYKKTDLSPQRHMPFTIGYYNSENKSNHQHGKRHLKIFSW